MTTPPTDIAVVGWAQTPMVRHTDQSETQLLMDVITDALEPLGLTRADVDFTCLGSCDYITGQAFSFVSNLDAIGAWPPKRDSHVEMDGAWALYEAWLRLQEGDIEIAVVTGSGRSSTGDPALIYPMEMDPYFLAPLGADPLTFAALQARAVIDAGIADERSMAEVAVRSRGKGDVDALLAEDYVREPLRRHDVPPITDGAAAMVLATRRPGPRARRAAGLHHRLRPPHRVPQPVVPGARRLAVDPHRGRRPPGSATGRSRSPSCRPRSPTRSCCCARCSASATTSPSTRRAARCASNPIMATGLCRIGYAADHIFGGGNRALGPLDLGPVPATEPDLHPGGTVMSGSPCAIVGVGQTHHKSRRLDVSFGGLVREAVFRALDDAQMTMADIDAVVLGKAPDLFEGVMKPELYLSDALGAVGKPMFRVHTAGSVGGTTGIVAASHVQAGKHRTVLAVAFEKQSEGNAQFALGSGKGASLGAGGAFAPFIRAYIHRSGAPEHIGWKVAVKDRLNALKNPYAHLKIEDISIEKVKASPMMWEPIRFLESCPSSDGACAVVLTDEAGGKAAAADGRPPAWILGASSRSEPPSFPGRDPVRPAGRACTCADDVYAQAGITDPREQIDMAELYVPFSWHEAIWLEAHGLADEGDGWKMIDDGTTELDGALPDQRSGGVLSSNPIGASGPAPLRRGGQPGARRRRRAPGRRAPRSRWPWPTAPTASTSACGSSGSSLQPFG